MIWLREGVLTLMLHGQEGRSVIKESNLMYYGALCLLSTRLDADSLGSTSDHLRHYFMNNTYGQLHECTNTTRRSFWR
jgi:predicted PolB exonuclease-like 3'-5' exonuclease